MTATIRYIIIAFIIALIQVSILPNLDLVLMTIVFIAFDDKVESALIVSLTATVIGSLATGAVFVPLAIHLAVCGVIWFVIRTILATKTPVSLAMLGVGGYVVYSVLSLALSYGATLGGALPPILSVSMAGEFFYKLALDLAYLMVLYAIFSRSKYSTRAFLITGR